MGGEWDTKGASPKLAGYSRLVAHCFTGVGGTPCGSGTGASREQTARRMLQELFAAMSNHDLGDGDVDEEIRAEIDMRFSAKSTPAGLRLNPS